MTIYHHPLYQDPPEADLNMRQLRSAIFIWCGYWYSRMYHGPRNWQHREHQHHGSSYCYGAHLLHVQVGLGGGDGALQVSLIVLVKPDKGENNFCVLFD